MYSIRKASDRGIAHHDWLQSYHSFSFADYHDSRFMGFKTLRVINEDYIAPGKGFATHRHHDMEILTYVIDGVLEHRDSMGTGSQIMPGEIQIMSAGSGIAHSEFNASSDKALHLLQIWILPSHKGIPPRYEQETIPRVLNHLIPIAAPPAHSACVVVHQDVFVYVGFYVAGTVINHDLRRKSAWVQIIKGTLVMDRQTVIAGDGVAIEGEKSLDMVCESDCEFLLFEFDNSSCTGN